VRSRVAARRRSGDPRSALSRQGRLFVEGRFSRRWIPRRAAPAAGLAAGSLGRSAEWLVAVGLTDSTGGQGALESNARGPECEGRWVVKAAKVYSPVATERGRDRSRWAGRRSLSDPRPALRALRRYALRHPMNPRVGS
jgi:hypothetical protein